MRALAYLSLRTISWDCWDTDKPSLWQIHYLNQLMQQTKVSDVDIEFRKKNTSCKPKEYSLG